MIDVADQELFMIQDDTDEAYAKEHAEELAAEIKGHEKWFEDYIEKEKNKRSIWNTVLELSVCKKTHFLIGKTEYHKKHLKRGAFFMPRPRAKTGGGAENKSKTSCGYGALISQI